MRNIETVSWHPRAQGVLRLSLCDRLTPSVSQLPEQERVRGDHCAGRTAHGTIHCRQQRGQDYDRQRYASQFNATPSCCSSRLARSSSGYWFMHRHPIIVKAARQIEEWTRLPQRNGEAFYVLRYDIGQQYKAHVDFFGGNYLKSGAFLERF